jgi:hypothetical protein
MLASNNQGRDTLDMQSPERIHINWNASDGYETFLENGIDPRPSNPPSIEQIAYVLAKQEGKLFRLLGWVDEPQVNVSLKIIGSSDTNLSIINYNEPSFDGEFVVADEPSPMMTIHGDFVFDLVNVNNTAH